jgi:hypothetical protein
MLQKSVLNVFTVKKFKVFVKDPSTGNVKKVNFGDKTMRIKKSNPKRGITGQKRLVVRAIRSKRQGFPDSAYASVWW